MDRGHGIADTPNDPSPSFCALPWLHVFADERGVMYPCCRSVSSQMPNVRDDGKPLKIHDADALQKGWNSAYMRELRRDMLAGRRPKPCERCYMYEDIGIRSHRQSQNAQYCTDFPRLLAATTPDGGVPLNLRSVDLRIGNLCNLRCRMCSPQSSKALIQEWAEIHGVPADHDYFEELRQLDWFAQPDFWRTFEAHAANVERLHFAGGEPFLIEPMFDFLEHLIERGRAKDITISYNTNLTVLPRRVFDLWPHFRSVRVTVSLDGYDSVNSFIRYPSTWSVIDRNLKILNAESDRLNCGAGLGINTTVQVYNVFRLEPLLDYAASTLTRFEVPNLSILSYPEHLSIRILPAQMKQRAATALNNLAAKFERHAPTHWANQAAGLLAAIRGIVDHMMGSDRSDLIPDFCRWCAHQDRFRRQDVLAVLPELGPLLAPVAA